VALFFLVMEKKTKNPERVALVAQLAEQLGVDLKDTSVATATANQSAKARMYDGSLEATVVSSRRGSVYIDSPRSPSIFIELVDHQRDALAPEGAIYCIQATMPKENPYGEQYYESLNGDVFNVYVGINGIILDDAERKRAAKLFKK